MALVDLWMSSRDQLQGKQVQQIIAFAGDGKLRDGSQASSEFRDFLAVLPSSQLDLIGSEYPPPTQDERLCAWLCSARYSKIRFEG